MRKDWVTGTGSFLTDLGTVITSTGIVDPYKTVP
jgi:hypothetical protein